jgi:hypothetical protein
MGRFYAALESCAPKAAMEAVTLFNQWWNDTRLVLRIPKFAAGLAGLNLNSAL